MLMTKPACFSDTWAPPTRKPFRPHCSMRLPAKWPSGRLKVLGAVCMNAGAYGGEMKQVLTAVTAWFPDEGVRRLVPEELDLSYRHSVFSDKRGVVLEAELLLILECVRVS